MQPPITPSGPLPALGVDLWTRASLVEAHCHLDKTLYGGPWVPHSAGDALADRIANDRRPRRARHPERRPHHGAARAMVAAGTSHVRTHTDVDPEVGLRGVEVVASAAERLGGRIAVEQVAFPQHGLLTNPGTAELLEEALKEGVETIGGIDPAGMDGDPVRHLDVRVRSRRALRRRRRHPPARRRLARPLGARADRRAHARRRAGGPGHGQPRVRLRPGRRGHPGPRDSSGWPKPA